MKPWAVALMVLLGTLIPRPLLAGRSAEGLRFAVFEVVLTGSKSYPNPFLDVDIRATFTAPSGREWKTEGFHDGGNIWRIRHTPDEVGDWTYTTISSDATDLGLHRRSGTFRCTESNAKGYIRIHPENAKAFSYADGTPFFPMGDTCYGFFCDSAVTPALRQTYLKARRDQRFNFVRMGILHSPTHGESDHAFWPWEGTPQKPDLDRYNPAFFQGLDDLLRVMGRHGMNAELILLDFYQAPFTDTRIWTPEREHRWLRYVLARYAAFPNVFLFTLANEYETHPDGAYRLDQPGDVEWVKATARFVKRHDPYGHPVTVHPVVSASTRGQSPNDPIDAPWRIGEFFGEDPALDVLSQQTGQAGVWDDDRNCWTGDAPTLVASLRADLRHGKPVLNSESGYEYLRGYPTYNRQVHHTDKVRRSAWRVVCAGGYFASGFAGTLGMGDFWNTPRSPDRYPFVVKDEGAPAQLRSLYEFFTALAFWRLEPFEGVAGDAVALADPGRLYVAYLPAGGTASLDLSSVQGPVRARWFDPRAGRFVKEIPVEGGRRVEFQAPDEKDWALLVGE